MPILSQKIKIRVFVKAGEEKQVVVSKRIPDDSAQVGTKIVNVVNCCGMVGLTYSVRPKTTQT